MKTIKKETLSLEDQYVVYGTGDYFLQFRYLFPDLKIKYFLESADLKKKQEYLNFGEHEKLPIYELESHNLMRGGGKIVICQYDTEKAVKKLEAKGLRRTEDFVLAEDFFTQLDFPIYERADGRTIVFWGYPGVMAEQAIREKNIAISYYVDEHPLKRMLSNGSKFKIFRLVRNLSFLKSNKNCFFIINKYIYEKAAQLLEEAGYEEEKDFISDDYFRLLPSEMLKKALNETTVYRNVQCKAIFEGINVLSSGNVYCGCCPEWIDYPLGNIARISADEAWKSSIAKVLRVSILNRTYTFCDRAKCRLLFHEQKEERADEGSFPNNIKTREYPENVLISIDHACNLSCPQCREKKFLDNDDVIKRRQNKIISRLHENGWLDQIPSVTIGGDGETFFSDVYKKILFDDLGKHKRKNITIMTNGVLFSEEYWKKLREGYEDISFSVSLDAATEEAYRITRGGNWKRLIRNMEFLSELRKHGEISQLAIKMVVQRNNYKDMPEFVKLGIKWNADIILFTKIWEGGIYTEPDELEKVAMVNKDGTYKEELKMILKDPLLTNEKVRIEF